MLKDLSGITRSMGSLDLASNRVEPASFVGQRRKGRNSQRLELTWFLWGPLSTTKDSAPPATRGERVLEGALIRGGPVQGLALAKTALQDTAPFFSIVMLYKLTTPAPGDLDRLAEVILPCGY